ncbi:MAG TPA: hypothetical protein VLT79_05575 [Gemmatimonadales bacterium]|nr:hypothetical protein [Gemmatimonadales bacterium]
MPGFKWARLQADVNCALRRGAWYRVRHVTGLEAIVEVNRLPQAVPSFLLQIVSTPPKRWTVVPRPREASRFAGALGARYAVCPSCRERTALKPSSRPPRALTCDRCRGEYEIDWTEGYLTE